MKKRISVLILMIVISCTVVYLERIYIKKALVLQDSVNVCFTNKELDIGDKITADDIVYKQIKSKDMEEFYVTNSEEIVGSYTNIPLSKFSVLSKLNFSSEMDMTFVSSTNNRLVTFEFDMESSNAWNIRRGQNVDIMYVDKENGYKLFHDIIVVDILVDNQNMEMSSEGAKYKYVSFEMPKQSAYELISNREKGDIEIIIK